MNVAGELVDAHAKIAQLRSELERLRDVVCETDVNCIDAILEENKACQECAKLELINARAEASRKCREAYRKSVEDHRKLRKYQESKAQQGRKAGYAVTNADSRKGMR